MKQVLNEMAKIKKKVQKIEKRSQTQKPPEHPRNVPRAERTAGIPKFSEVVKSPQGMTMEEVVNAQTVELARVRAQVDKQAERGQISTDVTNQDSKQDDESGPHSR